MKTTLFLIFLIVGLIHGDLTNLLNTPEHTCIRCLCHAVSGCYQLQNCANYTVTLNYWMEAGSPLVSPTDPVNEIGWRKCITNDNCILHAINAYTDRKGELDCNCDNDFNCEDKFILHYDACEDINKIDQLKIRRGLFRKCSGQVMDVPRGTCVPTIF